MKKILKSTFSCAFAFFIFLYFVGPINGREDFLSETDKREVPSLILGLAYRPSRSKLWRIFSETQANTG